MSQSQSDLIDRRFLEALYSFIAFVLVNNLVPVEVNDTGEDIGIKLNVFDIPKVFGESLGREGLGLSLAIFVPSNPPAFDVLPLVYPWFSHSLNCIVTFPVSGHWHKYFLNQIVPKRRHEK